MSQQSQQCVMTTQRGHGAPREGQPLLREWDRSLANDVDDVGASSSVQSPSDGQDPDGGGAVRMTLEEAIGRVGASWHFASVFAVCAMCFASDAIGMFCTFRAAMLSEAYQLKL
jgi:hypothetical protein